MVGSERTGPPSLVTSSSSWLPDKLQVDVPMTTTGPLSGRLQQTLQNLQVHVANLRVALLHGSKQTNNTNNQSQYRIFKCTFLDANPVILAECHWVFPFPKW